MPPGTLPACQPCITVNPDDLTKFCDHCRTVSALLTSPPAHTIPVTECPCKCHYYGKINHDNLAIGKPRRKRK